nr:MAG TPA: hypothetical protein [Bacteriophage sp.]
MFMLIQIIDFTSLFPHCRFYVRLHIKIPC